MIHPDETPREHAVPPTEPAPVAVASVFWKEAQQDMPDDDILVLATVDGEVWPAFHDGDQWRDAEAFPIARKVTHWAHFPEPPTP